MAFKAEYILGVDTGGTFTDFVLYHKGRIKIHKVLSTPQAPEQAILKGMDDLGLMQLLDRLKIIHGSTVATNAVLEGKGVKTAYVTNRGFKDVLTIGRQARSALYDLTPRPKVPPVPQALCFEVDVRRDHRGHSLKSLNTEELEHLAKQIEAHQPRAVVINLLYSYVDARDEISIQAYLEAFFAARNLPLFCSRSSEVLPEYKEYERGIATWLNAWTGPRVEGYLQRLQQAVKPAPLTIMQSSGGTIDAAAASRNAVRLLLSGPAGGLCAARFMAQLSGYQQILTFDMGGTSTDVALIDGEITLTNQSRIAGYPVAVPMVDMHTIGAGGGSIAYIDQGGMLQTGPISAGAEPGPACYGGGGTQATVTDANLILDRILPGHFLGGKMKLDKQQAYAVVRPLAQQLQLSIEDTAQGIIDIANEHMAQALRVMSVQKGIDPRSLALVSFGGAGALHVCALAEKLGINRAIIPAFSGVLSALGMLTAPASRELSLTFPLVFTDSSPADSQLKELEQKYLGLEQRGRKALQEEGIAPESIQIEYRADLRYYGQSYTLGVKVPAPALLQPHLFTQQVIEGFHQLHAQRYGHRHPFNVELVNLHVSVQAASENPRIKPLRKHVPARVHHCPDDNIYFYQRDELACGQTISGPAIITEQVATTYIQDGWAARADEQGNLILHRQ